MGDLLFVFGTEPRAPSKQSLCRVPRSKRKAQSVLFGAVVRNPIGQMIAATTI
jgi:hypothetical protein